MEARDFHTCRPRVGQPKFFSTSLRSQGGVFFDTIGYYLAQKLIEQALE
jgi:hypothetical protein